MKYLYAIIVGICFVSCNSDELEKKDADPLVKQIKFDGSYLDGLTINPSEINFNFEYDSNNRLIKKVGGYFPMSTASGYSSFFSDKLYTSLVYTDNKVTVENFDDSDDFSIAKNSVYYTLNSANLIEEKEIPNTNVFHSKKQLYKYANGKLVEIITSFPNMPYDQNDIKDYVVTFSEKFYYNNDNLIKTEYFEQHNGESNGKKIIRTFEDYDNSFNPFKRMQLLEDYFYRSLSKNNYRKYTETTYYHLELLSKREANWTFLYDANGTILYL